MTSCPVPRPPNDCIVLGHGSGGRLTHALVSQVFVPAFGDAALVQGDDGAVLSAPRLAEGSRIVVSTDAHVVRPLFFRGGDHLSVHDERGGGVMKHGIDAEHTHSSPPDERA